MRRFNLKDLSENKINRLCKREAVDFEGIIPAVQKIIDEVRLNGDKAVQYFNEKFDGISPNKLITDVPEKDSIELPDDVKNAFDIAYDNIFLFHKAQIPPPITVETMPGVVCYRQSRPIDSVGLYVPGGSAVLPSSVLMLGVPAQIAGCREVIIATPPRNDGTIAPEILYCASLCGITKVLSAGGAHGVAALAYGTESIPKTDKILGPGNQYVTCAKMLLQLSDAMVSIDMPAGPSEVLIIADETADPEFLAADLLSQAEHGGDSQVVLVSTSEKLAKETEKELLSQLPHLSRRKIAEQALDNSFIILAENLEKAVEFSNKWAPEHLILSFDNAAEYTDMITNAGSVFTGHWTPESVGDYASGTNHTLPTSGYARMYSGVSLDSFLKFITFQEISPEGLQTIGKTVETMAATESLDAHRLAVSKRLQKINIINNEK
jgi:histidinol dehydrogenase